jgi:hypothetical protein
MQSIEPQMRSCASGNLDVMSENAKQSRDSGFIAARCPGMTVRIQIVLADPLIALADFAGLPCDEKISSAALGISMRMH